MGLTLKVNIRYLIYISTLFILVSEIAIMSKFIFVVLIKYSRSSIYLLIDHVLIWNIDKDLLLFGIFKVWISSIYLHFTALSGSLIVWLSVLNWLNNWLRFARCFKTNVLLYYISSLRESVRFSFINDKKLFSKKMLDLQGLL